MAAQRPEPAAARVARSWQAGVRVFGGAATALVAVALMLFLLLRGQLGHLLAWVDGLGWAAAPLFVLLFSLEVVILLPGIVFPLAAGFFFGWAEGTLLSVLGKLVGSTCAFLLARRLLGRGALSVRARERLGRSPRLRLLAEALPRGGWRTVALVRLVPLIPFKLSNYLFGWSQVRLRDFVLGTLIGTVPYSLSNAYLGSTVAGRGVGELGAARTAAATSPAHWWISASVALVASAAAIAVARRALRALRAAASESDEPAGAGAPEASPSAPPGTAGVPVPPSGGRA
jgi:uncharacterized membrane protein YdjX (TVP38/TMEM64 family)